MNRICYTDSIRMPNPLPLTYYPQPSLQQRSRSLTKQEILSPEIQELIAAMIVTMHAEKGVGLAAPQIGRNIRSVIVSTDDGDLPLLNPRILWRSFRNETDIEGCLSIPGVYGEVSRSAAILVRATNPRGESKVFFAKGFFARVIQHEIDHLDGILFIFRTNTIIDGKDRLARYAANAAK